MSTYLPAIALLSILSWGLIILCLLAEEWSVNIKMICKS